ncbi:MAG: MATE family efflux transporter [Candidatus Aegiribacteria sp.]|nr:MATE family efflux transporter [Candidatus Aegiribacteria sp.]MBD3295709.1 MATE family efflux transporter [Candidatus Fermentibacteria bacterium]
MKLFQNRSSGPVDMTAGSVRKKLLLLAWPVMLSHLLHTLYNLADAFWLGKLGRQALNAPTITMHVVFIGFALAMGLGAAGTTLVSQYKGAGKEEKAADVAAQLLSLLTGIGLVLGVAGYLLTPTLLDLLQTPPDSWQMTYDYMRFIFMGIPLLFAFTVYQAVSTGLGDTLGPMQVNLVSVILNLILDPILIFGFGPIPPMGVVGAAVATVFCRAVASFFGVARLFRGRKGFRIHIRQMLPQLETVKKILKIGLPVGMGQMGTSLGFTVMIGIVNSFGSAVTAAFGVGNRIIHMAMVPAMGLSQANATAVGQNLGAGDPERAEESVHSALLIIGSILLPVTTLMFFFGGDIARAFVNDPAVIELGRTMFHITTPSVFVFGFLLVILGSFQGSGHTMPVMVLNMSRLWALRIPGAYLLAYAASIGAHGIWWAMFISNTVTAVSGWLWFKTGSWKKKGSKLVREPEEAAEIAPMGTDLD